MINSLNAINNAFKSLDNHATNIARAPQDDNINLAKEIVGSLSDKHQVAANTTMIKVQDEVLGSLLDMVG